MKNTNKDHFLHLVIVTPYGCFFEGDVDFVAVPNSDGERGIYPNRAPYVGAVYPGSLRFLVDDQWSYCFVSNGYCQVGHSYVVVICNAAEWADEIDLERAQKHISKNEERLKNPDISKTQKNIYEHSIRRNKKRVYVYEQFAKIKLGSQNPEMKALAEEAKKYMK